MSFIQVRMSKQNGKIVSDPVDVKVKPGDQVSWTSGESDLTVTFGADHPFQGQSVFHNGEVGQVRLNAPRIIFTCTVTLGGATQSDVTGVDIRP